jgi:hypothetical protein
MAADLGAWLCFEDESGQGLRPYLFNLSGAVVSRITGIR